MACSCLLILLASVLGGIGYFLFKFRTLIQKLLFSSTAKWNNTPKDVVILHGVSRGKCIPNPSPFVLKVETYCRMAKIPYEFDEQDPFGPKGKTPWISLNGTHVADSQLVIEFLNKKFEKDLSAKFTKEQRALARTIRIMIEEHAFWGVLDYRWVTGLEYIKKIMNLDPSILPIIKFMFKRRTKSAMWAQGIGRHSYETMMEMVSEDFRNLSTLLGNKKFILGDEPCEEDCAIFGLCAEVCWAAFNSPLEKLLNEELINLKEYCIRMKKRYWPDWDNLCVDRFPE